MPAFKDLTGLRFGRLTTESCQTRASRVNRTRTKWFCQCDCGRAAVVAATALLCGHTQSCGCLQVDRTIATSTTHGQTGGRTYRTWVRILARCRDPSNIGYPDYGGRGITVCERWLSYENFFEDMGDRPRGKTIERKSNGGNYQPENCCWATPKQQANNRRSNRILFWDGEDLTLAQIADTTGIARSTLWNRLNRGLTIEQATR